MSTADGLIVWDDVLRVAKYEAQDSGIDPNVISNFPESDREWFIQEAYNFVSAVRHGFVYAYYMRVYYTAHKAVLSLTPAAGKGTTGSESIGGVSVTNTLAVNNPTAEQGVLETHFGRQYHTWREKSKKTFNKFYTGQ
jgi:hypothetical protein